MKIGKLAVFMGVVAIAFMFGSVATAGLSDGLIAYYPFNGNANDESGNGHHGTVYGATLTQDRCGNADSAYSFDGNDRIDVPDDSIFTSSVRLTLE
jgi:hypothetical protein